MRLCEITCRLCEIMCNSHNYNGRLCQSDMAYGKSASFINLDHCPKVGTPAITAQEAHAAAMQKNAITAPKVSVHTSPNNDIFPYITVKFLPNGLYAIYAFL